MSDAGNVLPQAEIDAIFKQATGRGTAEPEMPVSADNGPAPPDTPPAKAGSPDNETKTVPAGSAETPPPDTVIPGEIMRKLDSLDERIARLESTMKTIESAETGMRELQAVTAEVRREVKREKQRLNTATGNIEKIAAGLKDTPGSGLRRHYVCSSCGEHGYAVIPVRCSVCGAEGWWGWWLETK
jgi:uncharacterized coiled-coil protein SlyX